MHPGVAGEAGTGSDRDMRTLGLCVIAFFTGWDGENASKDAGDTWASCFIKILPTVLPLTLTQSHSLPPPPAPTEVDLLMTWPPAPNVTGFQPIRRRGEFCGFWIAGLCEPIRDYAKKGVTSEHVFVDLWEYSLCFSITWCIDLIKHNYFYGRTPAQRIWSKKCHLQSTCNHLLLHQNNILIFIMFHLLCSQHLTLFFLFSDVT